MARLARSSSRLLDVYLNFGEMSKIKFFTRQRWRSIQGGDVTSDPVERYHSSFRITSSLPRQTKELRDRAAKVWQNLLASNFIIHF